MTEPEPPPVKWAPCACGGVIVSAPFPLAIESAVIAHQSTVRHLQWRIVMLKRETNE